MANPNLIDTVRVEDIQLSANDYRAQFEAYWESGDYASAFGILTTYQNELKTYVANQTTFNKIIYGIVANEFSYDSNTTTVFTTLEQEQQTNIDRIIDKLAFSDTTQYEVNNFCSYDQEIYFCIATPEIGTLPTDTDYWLYVGIRGDEGIRGLGVNLRGKWVNNVTYFEDDVVFYDDKIYVAKITNEGVLPTTTSTWLFSFSIERETIQVSDTTPDVQDGAVWIQTLDDEACVWKLRDGENDDDLLLLSGIGVLPTSYSYESNNHIFETDFTGCSLPKYIAIDALDNILNSTDGTSWTLDIENDFVVNNGTYGKNSIILVGASGNAIASRNLGEWGAIDIQFGTSDAYNVKCIGNNFFAVGLLGKISKSTNVISWSALTSGISTTLRGIDGSDSLILAVGDGGVVIKSTDSGANWSSATSVAEDILDIRYYDSVFYLLTTHKIYTTSDGSSYTAIFDNSDVTLESLCVRHSIIGVVGNDATSGIIFVKNTVDEAWSQTIISDTLLYDITSGYYGFVVGGQDGLTYISENGTSNWSVYSTYEGNNVQNVISILDTTCNTFNVTAIPTSAFQADDTIEIVFPDNNVENIQLYNFNKELAGDDSFVANVPISLVVDINNPNDKRAYIDTDNTVLPRLIMSSVSLDDTTISWNAVDGATSYSILSGEAEIATTTDTTLNLVAYITEVGSYNIYVVASGEGFRNSLASNQILYVAETLPTLDTPSISLNSDTISWSSITNATSYLILSSGVQISTTTNTSIDLTDIITVDGTYYITVVARGVGYTDSNASNQVTWVYSTALPTLSSPTIQLSGDIVSWSAVLNATSYSIRSSGTQIATTSSTSVDLSAYLSANGTYYITVVARASGYNNSSASNQITYTIVTTLPTLGTPSISLNNDTLSWGAISGATSYAIKSSGATVITTASTSINLSGYFTTNGTYYITVVARASGYNDSNASNQVTYIVSTAITYYTISYNANGGTGTVASQTVASGGDVTLRNGGYTRDGYTLAGWSIYSTGSAQYPYGEVSILTNVTQNYLFYAIWTLNRIDNPITVTWYGEANRALKATAQYAVTSTLSITVRVNDELYGTHNITITISNGSKYGYYMSPDNDISSFTVLNVSPTSDTTYTYTYSSGTVVYV